MLGLGLSTLSNITSAPDTLTSSPKTLRIAYLGPPASFSHQAALEAFPEDLPATHHPLQSFKDVFSAIQTLAADPPAAFDYAIIPVENSTNGSVVQVLDLLVQCGLDPSSCLFPDIELVAEHYLEVHHCLFIHPASVPTVSTAASTLNGQFNSSTTTKNNAMVSTLNIANLYTHPQVWGQCDKFLSTHLGSSNVERIDMSSTSAAAAFVSQDPPNPGNGHPTGGISAAICSSLAGTANNLQLIASNIEDLPGENTTRFVVMRNRHSTSTIKLPLHLLQPLPLPSLTQSSTLRPIFHKSLLTFTTPHDVAGSLALALEVFKKHDVNLTAITTRPSRQRSWHYVFFVECVRQATPGRENKPSIDPELLRDLDEMAERTCWLGSWVDRLDHG